MKSFPTFAAAALALVLPLGGAVAGAAEGDCYDIFPNDPATEVLACHDTKYLTGLGGDVGNLQGIGLTDGEPTSGDRRSGGVNVNVVPGVTFVDNTDSRFSHTIHGSFNGVIDELSAAMYLGNPLDAALAANPDMRVRLRIDGTTVYDNYGNAAADTAEMMAVTHDSELQTVYFQFTGLYSKLADNTASTEHEIVLQFSEAYYGDGNHVLYYDSAETPSSLSINDADAFGTVLK